MQFVICSDETYNEHYKNNHHQYIKLEDIHQLHGFLGITVLIHDDDIEDPDLAEQAELLHDFGVIFVKNLCDGLGGAFWESERPKVHDPVGSGEQLEMKYE